MFACMAWGVYQHSRMWICLEVWVEVEELICTNILYIYFIFVLFFWWLLWVTFASGFEGKGREGEGKGVRGCIVLWGFI